MGSGRRKRTQKTAAAKAKDDRQELIRSIDRSLDSQPIDLDALQGIALRHGFVNDQVRAKVWPALLGIRKNSSSEHDHDRPVREHRDSNVVECDIQRSLWAFTEGWSDEAREAKRGELRIVLTAAVTQEHEEVYYYQGLHDIAAVLLFVVGQELAAEALAKLCTAHLRDYTRATLEAALELLSLLPALLSEADADLSKHIQNSGTPPFYALSWLITWFAHNCPSLEKMTRAFDVLLAAHPMMPLYMCVSVIKASRKTILLEDDPSELHRLLARLPIFERHSVEDTIKDANRLFAHVPPGMLVRKSGAELHRAAGAEARIEQGVWIVPEKKDVSPGLQTSRLALAFAEWSSVNSIKTGRRIRRQPISMQILGGLVVLSSALVAMYASQSWQG